MDAIINTLESYDSKLCELDILSCGVGNVTEQDIHMAEIFDGKCLCLRALDESEYLMITEG